MNIQFTTATVFVWIRALNGLSFVNLGGNYNRFDGGWEVVDGEVNGGEVGY